MNSCAFTGHRPDRFLFKYDEQHPLCRKIKKAIFDECQRLYISENVKTFYTGCALGTDLWGAEAVLQLRGSFPDVKLICAVPYPNHTLGQPHKNFFTKDYEGVLFLNQKKNQKEK